MSWFKRSPRRNEPHKPHVYHPPHPTPATERSSKEAKATGPEPLKKKRKPL